MAMFESTPAKRGVRASAALIVAPALACMIGLSAVASEPEAKGARKESTPVATATVADGGKTAREAMEALRELNAAVQRDSKAGEKSSAAALPALPKKKVVPPTLTPAELDALVEKSLESSKAPLVSITSDVEFVRRIYLDVTGKLPTPEQTRAFVTTREKDKRPKLIEHLLNSPEYATNWARYWRDVIKYHATNQNANQVGYNELDTWLAKQLSKNRPWDEISRDLITGTGRNDENGAVAFALSHEVQAVEMAGEVSRIFLGVQIQCAQCHDHPNDSWKRQQFHEFAAFFAGAQRRRANPKENPAVFEVRDQPRARYTMPDLKDPTKQIPIAPKFFLTSDAKPLPMSLTPAERHALAADYVTNQDNPWFAKAYVNRIWYTLLGDSFYSPVDDMGPQRTAKAPEVLEALATQWQKGGYDVRWLFRTILNSKTYQREVRSTFSPSGRTPFASNAPSRLRADQILDSLAQALNLPLDGRPGGPGPGMTKKGGALAKKNSIAADLKGATAKKAAGMGRNFGPRNLFNGLFGVDPSIPSDDILGTIPQALFLMNGPQVNRAVEARPNTVLGEILSATPDNRQALNALYLRVFAREPTAKEVQTCGRYIETVGNRREAFEDILWSLINSTEFITRR
jgi:hypothetical protein